jgi:hypothetical protein
MPTATTDRRHPARPVLDLLAGAGRYARATREGFTVTMVEAALDQESNDGLAWTPAEVTLNHLVCGNLLFMRCAPHPTTAPKYAWAYVPTAAYWRLAKATADHDGPTEEEIEEAVTQFLVYGAGRSGGAR